MAVEGSDVHKSDLCNRQDVDGKEQPIWMRKLVDRKGERRYVIGASMAWTLITMQGCHECPVHECAEARRSLLPALHPAGSNSQHCTRRYITQPMRSTLPSVLLPLHP